MPGNKILNMKRGSPPLIHIEIIRRNNKKYVTYIRGLEEYGINGTKFAHDLSKRFACASTVETTPTDAGRAALKHKDHVEVLVQGHLKEELEALLTGDERLSSHGGVKNANYNIPQGVIKVRKNIIDIYDDDERKKE